MQKLSELEYATLADGLGVLSRSGRLDVPSYHALLIKLASNRANAGSKPEVLISNVRYEAYTKDGAEVAHGYALNHPRLGETVVRTSLVVSKAADGSSFETLNTRYVIVPNSRAPETSDAPQNADAQEVTDSVPASLKVPLSKSL